MSQLVCPNLHSFVNALFDLFVIQQCCSGSRVKRAYQRYQPVNAEFTQAGIAVILLHALQHPAGLLPCFLHIRYCFLVFFEIIGAFDEHSRQLAVQNPKVFSGVYLLPRCRVKNASLALDSELPINSLADDQMSFWFPSYRIIAIEQGALAKTTTPVKQHHKPLDFVVGRWCSSHQGVSIRECRFHQLLPAIEIKVKEIELLFAANENTAQVKAEGEQAAVFRWRVRGHVYSTSFHTWYVYHSTSTGSCS